MTLSPGPLQRIVNVHWGGKGLVLSIGFAADPTHLYADDTPTVVTLSVQGLPELSPNVFVVNLSEGATPPPFFHEAHYGGEAHLTDGAVTANWFVRQIFSSGAAAGQVSYVIDGPAVDAQIKVVMNLRPLSFLGLGEADNHYEWAGIGTAVIRGQSFDNGKSGRAGSGGSLTFTLDVTVHPPTVKFSVG